MLSILALFIFPVLMAYAASSDLLTMRIANWLVFLVAGSYFVLAFAAQLPLSEIGMSMAAAAIVLAVAFTFFAFGWIGGGDAKLFAAVVLWLGWPAAGPFMLVTALAGGALTLGLLSLRSGWFEPVLAGSPPWVRKLGAKDGDIPYGVAIAVGALMAFPQGALTLAVGA